MKLTKSLLLGLSLACALVSFGCSPRQPSPVPPAAEPPFQHQVKFSGETLSLIAQWYTGSYSNWHAIEAANPQINPLRLRPGGLVQIPKELLVRSEPLPATLVPKNITKAAPDVTNQDIPADGPPLVVEVADQSQGEHPAPAIVPARLEAVSAPEPFAQNASDASTGQALSAGPAVGQLLALAPNPDTMNKDLADAVMMDEAATVQQLLAKGADANTKSGGRPILTWAAQNGQLQMVALLLAAKADPDARDGIEQTALMRAASMGHKEIVVALLNAHASASLADSNGRTAAIIAEEDGHPEIVQLLSGWQK